jgi:hypothetical protein
MVQFTNKAVSVNAMSWQDAYVLGIVESKALGFDPAHQSYFTAGPSFSYPDRNALQPWYGYWLLIYRPEELTITFKEL